MAHRTYTIPESKTRGKDKYRFWKNIVSIFGTGRYGIAFQFKRKELFLGISINQLERETFKIKRKKVWKKGKVTPVSYNLD